MPVFRIYTLRDDGSVAHVHSLKAPDSSEAISRAYKIGASSPTGRRPYVEVWQGERIIYATKPSADGQNRAPL